MASIVKELPAGIIAREMDTLAFKELVTDEALIMAATYHAICYLKSKRGGYVYISREFVRRCQHFLSEIASQANAFGYDYAKAIKEAGFMLWDHAGSNVTKREIMYSYLEYPVIEISVDVNSTKPLM